MTETRGRALPFWLRPKWVLGHVLVIALVIAFVGLGFWQLDRLSQRRDENAAIAERSRIPSTPVTEVVPPGTGLDDVDDLRYRQVSLTGTWDADGEVLVRPRSLDGVSGWHVVTPLVLDDGRAALVTRGFAPLSTDLDAVREAVAPPTGEVTVTGLAFPTQERQGIGPTDPEDGVLEELARVDIGRIDEQYGRDLLPVYVQLATPAPTEITDLPRLLPAPTTDEGPHLSYAGQWFLFAGVGLVGWPLLLRHTAAEERRREDGDDGGGRGSGPGGGGGGGGGPPPGAGPPGAGAPTPAAAGTR